MVHELEGQNIKLRATEQAINTFSVFGKVVTAIPDEEIMGHRSMAVLTDRLSAILLAGNLSSPQVISLIHYIMQAGESTDAQAFSANWPCGFRNLRRN